MTPPRSLREDRSPRYRDRLLSYLRSVAVVIRALYHKAVFRILLPRNGAADSQQWLLLGNSMPSMAPNLTLALLARALVPRGWHCKPLFFGLSHFNHLLPRADEIGLGLVTTARNQPVRLREDARDEPVTWQIDYANGIVSACGINFFETINATLANFRKVYSTDFADPAVVADAEALRRSIESVLIIARRIEREARRGRRIILALMETHVVPNAILAKYFECEERQDLVRVYLVGPSFSWYMSGSLAATTAMMMRHNPLNHPYYARADEFDAWYSRLQPADHERIEVLTNRIVGSKRVRDRMGRRDDTGIEQAIAAARAAKRPVYCLYSHLFYDRPIVDKTDLFPTMLDWISSTIALFRDIDGLLILKPHVVELALPSHKLPNQRLVDFVETLDLPPNVKILPANQFLTNELPELVDAVLVWRSTALLEMTVFGVPTVFCGPVAPYVEPLRLRSPRSLDEYREMLIEAPRRAVASELARRTRAILYFLNVVKTVPLEIAVPLPSWLFGEAITVSPSRLLRTLTTRDEVAGSFARAVLAGHPSAYNEKPDVLGATAQVYG